MNGVTITYGKAAVPVYRVRDNQLMAVEVDVEVFGENFLPAYTRGRQQRRRRNRLDEELHPAAVLSYEGATLEGFLAELGRGFLETYEEMDARSASAVASCASTASNGVLYSRSHDDHGVAELRVSATRPARRCSPAAARAATTSSC